MRVVLDTNVLIDGASDPYSASKRLLEAVADGEITWVITPALAREYNLLLPQRVTDAEYLQFIENLLEEADVVTPAYVDVQIDDREDQKFLKAAVGGQVDTVVTSDQHLLTIGEIEAIPIKRPAEAWAAFQDDQGGEWTTWAKGLLGLSLWVLFVLTPGVLHAQEVTPSPSPSASPDAVDTAVADLKANQDSINAKQAEITDLDKKIADLQSKRDTTQAEATVIAQQVARLQARLDQAELELKKTQLNIKVVKKDQQSTQTQVSDLQAQNDELRQELRSVVRSLYEQEQTSLISMFFDTGSLSQVLSERATYQSLQEKHIQLMQDIRDHEQALKEQQQKLADQAEDLSSLSTLLAGQQEDLAQQKIENAQFLKAKQQEKVAYDAKLVEAQQARKEIEQDIFTLKSSGVKVSLTEATDIARYASKLTGVRAPILLGVLKVETNLGTNIGSGVFPDDMQPQSRDAFLRITKTLGLDPNKAPISARPRSYSGWGGAMGPAQIMPATWETISDRVAKLEGKAQANPYDLTDAFVATAVFLADRGATSQAGEYEAVNRYLAGPNWQRFTWYGDRVLAVAQEYEKKGL